MAIPWIWFVYYTTVAVILDSLFKGEFFWAKLVVCCCCCFLISEWFMEMDCAFTFECFVFIPQMDNTVGTFGYTNIPLQLVVTMYSSYVSRSFLSPFVLSFFQIVFCFCFSIFSIQPFIYHVCFLLFSFLTVFHRLRTATA